MGRALLAPGVRAQFGLALIVLALIGLAPAAAETAFRRIPTQFIAALGEAGATSGTGAETWGLWRLDPGPCAVHHARCRPRACGLVAGGAWFDHGAAGARACSRQICGHR